MNSTIIAYLLVAAFAILSALCFFFTFHEKGRKGFILAIYIVLFSYTIGQSIYYANALPGTTPDEPAHVSYILYLHNTDEIIPTFENMHLISGLLKWSEDMSYQYVDTLTNYLCHPPLYYQIMKLAGGIVDQGSDSLYSIDKMQMRYFSLIIFALGLGLLLYIGYSRLDKNKPWLHLFYASAATCIPMLANEGCAVTNDTLAILTACITILGLIRFSERKRGYLTYILIAVGITSSLLTKLTTALMCIIMAVLVLFACMIYERSIKNSLKKEFFVTIPIYCIALLYFAIIYSRYHTIQPSLQMLCTQEYFESTIYYVDPAERMSFDFSGYRSFYFNQFFLSWSGIVGTYNFLKATPMTKTSLPMELLWLFPVFMCIPAVFKRSKQLALPILSGWIACVITVLIQFKSGWGVYLTRGYLGGNQARYYLPFIFAFALSLAFIFSSIEASPEKCANNRLAKLWNYAIYLIAIGYAFILFYANFPFFLIHFEGSWLQ